MIKKNAWKILDWAIRRTDQRTLDKLRAVVPISIKRQLSRFLMKNAKLGDGIVTAKSGHRFASISEPVFLQVLYEGEYERELSNIARQLIIEGDNVVDIGANFGWYSVLMADAVGKRGRVFSFEPNGIIYDVLKQNIELNDFGSIVDMNKCGIGETTDKGKLLAKNKESGTGYISIDDGLSEADDVEAVEIHPLDEMVGDAIDDISFMKIDVEGFEPCVLRSARKVLETDNPPIILMEFNIEALERSKTDVDEFIKELYALGIPAVVSGGRLTKLDAIRRENANLFFFPKRGNYAGRIDSVE